MWLNLSISVKIVIPVIFCPVHSLPLIRMSKLHGDGEKKQKIHSFQLKPLTYIYSSNPSTKHVAQSSFSMPNKAECLNNKIKNKKMRLLIQIFQTTFKVSINSGSSAEWSFHLRLFESATLHFGPTAGDQNTVNIKTSEQLNSSSNSKVCLGAKMAACLRPWSFLFFAFFFDKKNMCQL